MTTTTATATIPPSGHRRAGDGPPFGLPVLDELPVLAGALSDLVEADRRQVRALLAIAGLRDSDEVEQTSGVPVEHWLAAVARLTRLDRRLLLRLCRQLERFPALRDAAKQGQLSFAQLRGISLKLKDAPVSIDAELDRWLAAAIAALVPSAEPDVLVRQVEQAIVELAPTVVADNETQAGRSRFLYLQPRLDGSGGRFCGEQDAVGFAILADAVAPQPGQYDHPGGVGAAMADNLLDRLLDGCHHDHDLDVGDVDAARGSASDLVDAVTSTCLPPVKLLVRLSYQSLLDRSQTPADLLTRLVGGRLRLTAGKARELVDARGAEVRAVVVDDLGQVVGIGRHSRTPPGWLCDAALALHDTCTGPICDLPARDAQLDHAVPWWPARPDDAYGTTDIDNLGPLCAASNRAKEQAGWQVTQTGDGQRTWHHPRSGLTVTTVPATWRPAGYRRPKRPPDRHPPRDPPGDPPQVHLGDDGRPLPF